MDRLLDPAVERRLPVERSGRAPSRGNWRLLPGQSLAFLKGTHTAYQFGSTGAVTATKTYTLSGNSSASTSSRSALTNQSGSFYSVTTGVWAGYWMRASDVVYLPGG